MFSSCLHHKEETIIYYGGRLETTSRETLNHGTQSDHLESGWSIEIGYMEGDFGFMYRFTNS